MSDCAAPASPKMPGTDYDHAGGAAVLAEHPGRRPGGRRLHAARARERLGPRSLASRAAQRIASSLPGRGRVAAPVRTGSNITKEMTKVGSLPGRTVLAHGQPRAEHQDEEHGTACSGVGVWRALASGSAAGGHGRAQVVAAEN
jgi:hypothetical protein